MSSVDAVVSRVAQQAATWRALDSARRADILGSCGDGVYAVAKEWVEKTCIAKGIAEGAHQVGEEWITGPVILLRHLRLYRDTLLRGGFPTSRLVTSERDHSWRASVFPFDRWDRLLFPGVTGEIRGMPNTDASCLGLGPGGCTAVLGAGNVQSIPPLDILYQLLKENRVVVAKLNPVNAYLRPFLERAFAPLVAAGFLGFVEGDATIGSELVAHPKIDAIHLTGSAQSFQRMLATEGVQGKQATAELGAVSPVIIVPGNWSRSDLKFHAQQIAGMLLVNNGFNCNSPKLLVTARGWPQREAFLNIIRETFRGVQRQTAWYPGSVERWIGFVHNYGESAPPHAANETPPILLADVPPLAEELALREEAFCAVLAETTLEAEDESNFLKQAVKLVNDSVYGTLSCTVIAAPSTEHQALENAVDELRYGTVGVNTWAGLGFALGTPTWGAFPGHTRAQPGSGLGVVHNTFLFNAPCRTILRGRFRPRLKPIWMPQYRSLGLLGPRLLDYEKAPSMQTILPLVGPALKG